MFKLLYTSIAFCFIPLNTTTTNVVIGSTSLQIVSTLYGNYNGVCFINLHSDESTSVEACEQFLSRNNGKLIQLKHKPQRNIQFEINNAQYTIDPNRIFTAKGIKATLQKLSKYNLQAAKEVEKFASNIIQQISDAKLIVALHNNGNKGLSINSYTKGGNEYANTAKVYVNPLMDEDDFIYTTNEKIFSFLKEQKVNVVLQKEKGSVDDGSLSIYYGSKKIPYINIEAEHGHLKEQIELLETLAPLFKEF